MARSKAKKKRMKIEREGRRNPSENRSPYAFVDLSTRITKTKKDYLYKRKSKNHFSSHEDNDSFFLGTCFIF
ncbi:hypothetical protein [Alkalicoccobacillus porphyridii]|uniref:Uncharacterized protein n=1 Tax=Alkalicoccobacillus porphyridii TaxID=2597270 RepID=A0A553ZWB0_9BACI|nr:hypothetical protein [Alkalicoccobacillus porphyridii]TSB45616.1 hypothetical protein FN960_15730 [Alkalicoccobacillus porphyridii]